MFRCGVLRIKVTFIPENTKCFSAEGEAPEKGERHRHGLQRALPPSPVGGD